MCADTHSILTTFLNATYNRMTWSRLFEIRLLPLPLPRLLHPYATTMVTMNSSQLPLPPLLQQQQHRQQHRRRRQHQHLDHPVHLVLLLLTVPELHLAVLDLVQG